MKEFCKIFKTEKYGQILCTAENNDDNEAVIKFSYLPDVKGLDVCSTAIGFKNEKGRDKWFNDLKEEQAIIAIKVIDDQLAEFKSKEAK